MAKLFNARLGWTHRPPEGDSAPPLSSVRPYGPYGGGLIADHRAGFIIAAGMLLMGLVGVPGARWFLGGSLALGVLFGFCLRRHHQENSSF